MITFEIINNINNRILLYKEYYIEMASLHHEHIAIDILVEYFNILYSNFS